MPLKPENCKSESHKLVALSVLYRCKLRIDLFSVQANPRSRFVNLMSDYYVRIDSNARFNHYFAAPLFYV